MLILCLVCVFSSFGGILLGQSLKGLLIFTQGLEKGQKKMFNIGVASVVIAVVLSIASCWIPGCKHAMMGGGECPRHGDSVSP